MRNDETRHSPFCSRTTAHGNGGRWCLRRCHKLKNTVPGAAMITSLRKRLMNRCASLMRRESLFQAPPRERPLRCAPVFGASSPCAGSTARVSSRWLCSCPRSGSRGRADLGKQATRCAICATRLASALTETPAGDERADAQLYGERTNSSRRHHVAPPALLGPLSKLGTQMASRLMSQPICSPRAVSSSRIFGRSCPAGG